MSYTSVAICNLALTQLSTTRIIALTENTENARKCNAIYELTRDRMLSEHPWNFCKRESVLSQVDDAPLLSTWAYIYQLPVGCLRVMECDETDYFEVYSDKVYSNEPTMTIKYLFRQTDESKFSAGFVTAFATRIAADLAFGITQNATLAQLMEQKAQIALSEAKWSDGQEGTEKFIKTGTFLNARQR